MNMKKLLANNYFYYSFLAVFISVVFYFAYTITGCSTMPQNESINVVGGTPPYYDGHDNEIAPNPNK